jgi:hypothetical protein
MRFSEKKCSEKRITLTVLILLFMSCIPVIAQYNEDVVKAAYIERITRFVEWPAKDSLVKVNQFVIGVFDDDEFYYTLTEVFKEKLIKEHRVKIITIDRPDQINTCNLCYMSAKAKSRLGEFILKANISGTLLISGTTGFCNVGVHINFYIEDEKLKFEINDRTIDSAGFKVSYLLLQNTRLIH